MTKVRKNMIIALESCIKYIDDIELNELFYNEILGLRLDIYKVTKQRRYLFSKESLGIHKKCRKKSILGIYIKIFLPWVLKIKRYIKYKILSMKISIKGDS